jgi:hypothetical protein
MTQDNEYIKRLKMASNNLFNGGDAYNMSKHILSDMKITKILLRGELIYVK